MNKKINEILINIRKDNKLTRKGLENLSGFKASTIESYERGTRKPSKEYIEFISLYFGYKKDYISGQIDKDINKNGWDIDLDLGVKVLLMYQAIYNYTNKQMSEKIGITLNEYDEILKDDFIHDSITSYKFNISEKLNIRPSCFWIDNNEYFEKDIKKELEIDDINILFEYKKRLSELEVNGLAISKEYYASIIKQRNTPQIVTPNTQNNSIPDKYKEVLELLPYAPDSFIETIIQKLKTMKESQTL